MHHDLLGRALIDRVRDSVLVGVVVLVGTAVIVLPAVQVLLLVGALVRGV